LPIRRRDIWLANWLFSAVPAVIFVLLLTVYRTIAWPPPLAYNDLQAFLRVFPDRWSLMVGGAAIIYWSICAAAFFGIFFKRELAAVGPVLLVSLAPLVMLGVVVEWIGLTPGVLDMAPIMFVSGTLFALGGWWVFAASPSHWSNVRRFGRFGLWVLLPIIALGLAQTYLACQAWSGVQWSKVRSVDVVDHYDFGTHIVGDRAVAFNVRERRSGRHLFILDMDDLRVHRIGRDVDLLNQTYLTAASADMRLYFVLRHRADGVLPTAPVLSQWNADQASIEPLFSLEPITLDSGVKYDIGLAGFFHLDDQWRIFWARDLSQLKPGPAFIVITTVDGRRIDSFPALRTGRPLFLVSEAGRLLAVDVAPENKSNRRQTSSTLLLYDLQTRRRHSIKIDGQIESIAPDLTRAAIVRPHVEDDRLSYSLNLVDLPSGRETTLISHDQTMRVFAQAMPRSSSLEFRFQCGSVPEGPSATARPVNPGCCV
jgi:hypothetical protein